jgi:hypothetical protein
MALRMKLMKILRFKGAVQEWTIPLRELSNELKLTLRLKSHEFIKMLNDIDDREFRNKAASINITTLERIFTAADAKQQ